jgi:hypothetical protein
VSRGREILIVGTAVLLPAAFIAYDTYGEKWNFTESEAGAIDGIEFGAAVTVSDETPEEVVEINNNNDLENELVRLAKTDEWCSDEQITYDDIDYPYLDLPDSSVISPGVVYAADLCIESSLVTVGADNVIDVFMGTHNPAIPQIEGNPSIFLTYNDPRELDECIAAKEQIRTEINSDLELLLGSRAINYEVLIHVDERNLNHPCDDSFGS